VIAGRCDPKQADIWDTVLKAHEAAFETIKAGIKASDVDRAARAIIENKGLGDRFVHGVGHGVGLNVHEPPRLGIDSPDTLEEHNVVTDEPAVYIPELGGVRIEDTVVVLKRRARRLTATPKTIACG
jgi:Xaa-Pro aminopeptidase